MREFAEMERLSIYRLLLIEGIATGDECVYVRLSMAQKLEDYL
jgi:hypothetical protein